jgi:aspartyl-tRNA(Asn)/glutamyl-tRNA(Gln) amidotransferase subunit B
VQRFVRQLELRPADARLIASELDVAAYFEECVRLAPELPSKDLVKWISGELFGWMKQSGQSIEQMQVRPAGLVELARACAAGGINLQSAKAVLLEMLSGGQSAAAIISARGLPQVSDDNTIQAWVRDTLAEYPQETAAFRAGKETLFHWLFGQVMRRAGGTANPQGVRAELEKQLRR